MNSLCLAFCASPYETSRSLSDYAVDYENFRGGGNPTATYRTGTYTATALRSLILLVFLAVLFQASATVPRLGLDNDIVVL